jgi:nucleotide-binding universal stress UspA family protein
MHGFVLVVLNRPDTARVCLEAAAHVFGALNEARIAALCVRIDPMSTFLPSEEIMTKERQAQIENAAAERAAVHRIYKTWLSAHPDLVIGRASWCDPVGPVQQQVRQRGRGADLIVLAPPTSIRDLYGREALKAAIFETDRPVLVVPGKATETVGRSVAILWDEEQPPFKAVLEAMPLLARAEQVFVLIAVDRDGDAEAHQLPQLFIDHGVNAEVCPIGRASRPFGKALLEAARRLGADLLITGAYPHHPIAELILGGVTRYLVSHADLPILMRH